MVRFAALTILSVFICSFAIVDAFAQPSATLSMETVVVGGDENVNLDFVNNGQVTLLSGEINFDPNIVSVDIMVGAPSPINVSGPALNGTGFSALASQPTPGRILIAVANTSAPAELIPDGTVALLSFTGINEGSASITWDPSSVFGNANGMGIAGNFISGNITVNSNGGGVGNVSIIKTADRADVPQGQPVNITYTIIIESTGTADAEDVMISDELPPGSNLVDASSGCTEPVLGIVECQVGSFPMGEQRIFEITINITPQGASIFNEAIASFLNGEVSASALVFITTNGGGGGGGGGCSLSKHVTPENTIANLFILLIPGFVFGINRIRRSI